MPQLLFVYNADAGLVNGVMDLFHKLLSPRTYPCSLCAVTYGGVSMRPEWHSFIKALPVAARFLHRDEFVAAYPALASASLPAAFWLGEAGTPEPFLSTAEIDGTDLVQLMRLVQQRLAEKQ
ncbi:hypothetical protein LJY25_07395 [Hymenobacter sp. BT175]|uniref:hypothetical protein n=1 Tax=Hymenobacter translucens TaxID=2886507 RepID=UPI001D0E8653|nr:hypothetical protein [Hymenobacter translucens]MCC2546265.1 hypothetical protein [Hymenobacter translucens]